MRAVVVTVAAIVIGNSPTEHGTREDKGRGRGIQSRHKIKITILLVDKLINKLFFEGL